MTPIVPLAASPGRKGDLGATSEMTACVDLMRRGYQVFRAVSPQCSCDLIAMHDGQSWRIEVRTGKFSEYTGVMTFVARLTDKCDVYAIVRGDKVGYLPSTFVGEPFPWRMTDSLTQKAVHNVGRL